MMNQPIARQQGEQNSLPISSVVSGLFASLEAVQPGRQGKFAPSLPKERACYDCRSRLGGDMSHHTECLRAIRPLFSDRQAGAAPCAAPGGIE